MTKRIMNRFREYPTSFWALIGATFIDHMGEALLFPFIALYLTEKFGVGFSEVGILFALFAGAHALGSFCGGALTDKAGRRRVIILGLVTSGLTSLWLGLANSIDIFYVLAFPGRLFWQPGWSGPKSDGGRSAFQQKNRPKVMAFSAFS